jgi:exonuclease SbcD
MRTSKVALVADSHFDEHSRFEECIRLHDWIADDAAARGVTLTLHAGDVYEKKSSPLERQAAAAWFQRMATLGVVVVGRGNHDAIDDLPLLERLETDHPIDVYERAGVVVWNGVAIAVLGWPQRGHLQAALGGAGVVSHELVEAAAGDALRAVFRGFAAKWADHKGPKLLLAHAMVRGSVTSTGQPLVGCDFEIGLDDLGLANADAYLLGHIHKGQSWKIGDAPVIYPGSPRRTAFGESEAKGYVVLELDEHGVIGCEFVEAPATPMVHLEARWEGPDAAFCRNIPTGDFENGAEIRLRYETASDARDAARAAAEQVRQVLLERGAVHVKVEEVVIAETRARSPEIAAAARLDEKLAALWAAKNFEPGERRSPLLAKAHQLEETNHAA